MKFVGGCVLISPEMIYSSIAVLLASLLTRRTGVLFNLFRTLATALAAITMMTIALPFAVSAGLTDLPPDSATCDTEERPGTAGR